MARPIKKGLDYFPLDVDFFEDDKIELINAEFGIKGENIAIRLLCLVYKNGYWYKIGEDENLLLAKRVGNGVTGASVSEIVKGLVRRSFFDERVFNSFQILTSKGIQKRFFEAVDRRKSIEIIPEIMLIDVNAYINEVNVSINPIKQVFSTQSKGKESKGLEAIASPGEPPDVSDEKRLKDKYKTVSGDKEQLKSFLLTDKPEFAEPFAKYWNLFAGEHGFPKLKTLTDDRRKKIKTRCKEPTFDFVKLIEKAEQSNHDLTKKWLTFDWLIESQKNYVKVLEGNYDKLPSTTKQVNGNHAPANGLPANVVKI